MRAKAECSLIIYHSLRRHIAAYRPRLRTPTRNARPGCVVVAVSQYVKQKQNETNPVTIEYTDRSSDRTLSTRYTDRRKKIMNRRGPRPAKFPNSLLN